MMQYLNKVYQDDMGYRDHRINFLSLRRQDEPDSTQQYVMDVFVRQATGIAYAAGTVSMNGTSYYGGNNCISFPAVSGAVSTTEISISVEQYQSLGGFIGLTSTASRMLFINNSGAVVTPVP